MTSTLTTRSRAIWAGMSLPDLIALAVLLLYGTLAGIREYHPNVPQSGFLFLLAICAAIYWLVRGWVWARDHLLWSLRNRLVAAYIFIAVVPVMLLLAMAGLAAYLLYWQLGSYVIYTEMEEREERVGVVATAMATSYAAEATLGHGAAALALPVDPATYIKNAMSELPGLKIETGKGEELLRANGPLWREPLPRACSKRRAVGVEGRGRAADSHGTHFGFRDGSRYAGVHRHAGAGIRADPVQHRLRSRRSTTKTPKSTIVMNAQRFVPQEQIGTTRPPVPKAANPFDKLITGIVGLEVLDLDRQKQKEAPSQVFASFSTRPSLLNRRLFSPLGDLGGAAATALLMVGGVFLVIEFVSLVTGIIMTRTITTAVDRLYSATQHVQEGDLTLSRSPAASRSTGGAWGIVQFHDAVGFHADRGAAQAAEAGERAVHRA